MRGAVIRELFHLKLLEIEKKFHIAKKLLIETNNNPQKYLTN